MGTDLYLAFSVADAWGNESSKGVLVQAKRANKCDWPELREQCRRMNLVTKKGSVVWLYQPTGIDVIRSQSVAKGTSASIDSTKFFDQVFKCTIGDRRKVPDGQFGTGESSKPCFRISVRKTQCGSA